MSEYRVRMILVGDRDVGKTSLLLRFTDDVFSETYEPTKGVDFKNKTIDMEPHTVKMLLIDKGYVDPSKTRVTDEYRGVKALVVVFSLTDRHSFMNVTTWFHEAELYGNADCVKLLVGNKCDLTSQRVVAKDKAQALADRKDMSYIETSAKDATNVHQGFTTLVQKVMEMKDRGDPVYSTPRTGVSRCTIF